MLIRLFQTKFCDCCSSGSVAFVYDSKLDKNYCSTCWGERLILEHPDYVIKSTDDSITN